MFKFKKKNRTESRQKTAGSTMSAADFAIYNTISGNQRSSYGERGEMCSGAMNNNQRLATLQMLRDFKD